MGVTREVKGVSLGRTASVNCQLTSELNHSSGSFAYQDKKRCHLRSAWRLPTTVCCQIHSWSEVEHRHPLSLSKQKQPCQAQAVSSPAADHGAYPAHCCCSTGHVHAHTASHCQRCRQAAQPSYLTACDTKNVEPCLANAVSLVSKGYPIMFASSRRVWQGSLTALL